MKEKNTCGPDSGYIVSFSEFFHAFSCVGAALFRFLIELKEQGGVLEGLFIGQGFLN